MVRVYFGTRNISKLSKIMPERDKLKGCIGDDVDYNYARKCVDEVNQQLREKGIKAKLILQKAVKWDEKNYRLIIRTVKG